MIDVLTFGTVIIFVGSLCIMAFHKGKLAGMKYSVRLWAPAESYESIYGKDKD